MSSPNENLPLPDNVPGELSLSPTVPTPDEAVPAVDVPSDVSPTGDSSNSGEAADPGFTAEDRDMLQKRDNDILQDLIQNLSVQTTNLDSPDSTSTGTVSVLGSSKTPTLSTDPEDGSSVLGTPSSDTGEGVLTNDDLLQAIQSRLPEGVDQSSAQTPNAPAGSNLIMETDSESTKNTPEDTPDEPKPIVEKHEEPTPGNSIPSQPTLQKVIQSSVSQDSGRMETDTESPKDTPDDSPDEPRPIVEEHSIPSLTPLPKYVTSPPSKVARKMETDSGSPKDTTEDSPDEPKAVVKEQVPRSSIPPLPPIPHPASIFPIEGSLSRSNSASASPVDSLIVRIPLALVTRQPESPKNNVSGGMKSKLGSDGDDSSLGSISQVEKSYKVDMSKRRDSSDWSKPGSEADESSQSCCASPDIHRKKALHKKVHRETTGTTPSLQAIRDHHPPLSRADTLDDVETIRTDSGSPKSRQISPDRDRRALSVPADPPRIDPTTAPEERRAYSEAKETGLSEGVMETDDVPEPPYPSLETSVSLPAASTESAEPERQVQSEPVKGWAKVVPVQQALSEGHTPASSFAEFSVPETSCVPEVRMLEDPRVGDDYAGDRSESTSDVDPMRERPRREDREADRQVREFNEALAVAAESSSGRGTDSNAPSSTLGTSEENRLAPIIGGYQGWFQQAAENPDDGEEENQSESKTSSEQSASKSTSTGMDDYYSTYFRPSPEEGEPQAGPSSKKSKEQFEKMDLLEVIPEKGESLSASPKSLSPVDHPDKAKTTEKDDDEATEMAEPQEERAKSRMALKLLEDDEGQRTPKRKRDRKKSGDSPKDPEVQSPGDDSRKRYCSEFRRPVMTEGRVRRCSTGSVTPFQAQNVNVASLKELAQKSVKKETKKDDPKDKKDPKDATKDKKDPKDRQEPSA